VIRDGLVESTEVALPALGQAQQFRQH
jgi:hypothetical protein